MQTSLGFCWVKFCLILLGIGNSNVTSARGDFGLEHLCKAVSMVKEELSISTIVMKDIAIRFQAAMADGLTDKPSSLKMLPSFIGSPTGQERGRVIAVDFGGTNVRVLLLELAGSGQSHIVARRSFPLKDTLGHYDYTAAKASGDELFDFIVNNISEIVPPSGVYPLGFTFSFPCSQHGVDKAVLISWTKELKTAGVEGQEVGQMLQNVLENKGLGRVQLQAVINDTTGTLLASAYNNLDTTIGSICGTGHNSCYLEPCHPLTNQPMIVNMESGNFDGVPQTKYDILLDQASEKPGAQRLEKMVSGYYLGELVRLIVSSFGQRGYLSDSSEKLFIPYSLSTADLSAILSDTSGELENIAKIVATRWGIRILEVSEYQEIQKIVRVVSLRSARLVAATWAGVLQKIDPGLERYHTIAIDGSLYEKMPGYDEQLANAIVEIFGEKANHITLRLTKDGSGIGAAIAAATVYNSKLSCKK